MNRGSGELSEKFFQRHADLLGCKASIEAAMATLADAFRSGNKVLICGNGGSAADAEHIVGELMKGFRSPRPIAARSAAGLTDLFPTDGPRLAAKLQGALPAISLVSQSSLCSAISNDSGAEMVFAQQVYGYGTKGDVLWAMSTSGTAKNVLGATMTATAFGLKTIGLTGRTDSPLSDLCDLTVQVPATDTAEVQEYHAKVYHHICAMLEVVFFGTD
jgi:D-sedoheptulose 7-phosphate isomerase